LEAVNRAALHWLCIAELIHDPPGWWFLFIDQTIAQFLRLSNLITSLRTSTFIILQFWQSR